VGLRAGLDTEATEKSFTSDWVELHSPGCPVCSRNNFHITFPRDTKALTSVFNVPFIWASLFMNVICINNDHMEFNWR
jgi:hypothetical protein